MEPLEFVPRGLLSADFYLKREDLRVGALLYSGWRNGGSLEIGELCWSIESQGFFRRTHAARQGLITLGSASPDGFWGRTIRINASSDIWMLEPKSWNLSSTVQIVRNGDDVGVIARDTLFARKGRCSMTIPVTDQLQAFLIWLTIKRWNEEASSD